MPPFFLSLFAHPLLKAAMFILNYFGAGICLLLLWLDLPIRGARMSSEDALSEIVDLAFVPVLC